jgi:hypothetical protein
MSSAVDLLKQNLITKPIFKQSEKQTSSRLPSPKQIRLSYLDIILIALAQMVASERTYGAPMCGLVIDDNPYRLMVAPTYVCRTCPWTMLEPYVGFKL